MKNWILNKLWYPLMSIIVSLILTKTKTFRTFASIHAAKAFANSLNYSFGPFVCDGEYLLFNKNVIARWRKYEYTCSCGCCNEMKRAIVYRNVINDVDKFSQSIELALCIGLLSSAIPRLGYECCEFDI